jgi:hypothetical protein
LFILFSSVYARLYFEKEAILIMKRPAIIFCRKDIKNEQNGDKQFCTQ